MSLNTASIGDSLERRKVFNYLKKNSSYKAVIFLQDMHGIKKKENYGITSGDVGKNSMFIAHDTSNSHLALIDFREGLNLR